MPKQLFSYNTGLVTFAGLLNVQVGAIPVQDRPFTLCYMGGETLEQYVLAGGFTNVPNHAFRCAMIITDVNRNTALMDQMTPCTGYVSTRIARSSCRQRTPSRLVGPSAGS